MNTRDRIKMTVTFDVTIPQALALQSMFNTYNLLSNMGASRDVAFFVDGDGNFHPKCKVTFDNSDIPLLTPELEKMASNNTTDDPLLKFDFDTIAWHIRDMMEGRAET